MNVASSLITPCGWTRTFFVEVAMQGLEEHWLTVFEFAFKTKGATVDLSQVPGYILPMLVRRSNELIEEEARAAKTK